MQSLKLFYDHCDMIIAYIIIRPYFSNYTHIITMIHYIH